MARQVVVTIVDDIDANKVAEESVEFSIDGINYEIDLSAENAQKLRHDISQWSNHARKVVGRGKKTKISTKSATTGAKNQSALIRSWAREQGIPVTERGRIPSSIVEQFHRAQSN